MSKCSAGYGVPGAGSLSAPGGCSSLTLLSVFAVENKHQTGVTHSKAYPLTFAALGSPFCLVCVWLLLLLPVSMS